MRTSRLDRFAALVVVTAFGFLVLGDTGTQAAFVVSTANTGDTFSTVSDWKPPLISRATVQKSQGGIPGYVRASGSYTVIASVTDDPSSNPPAGLASVQGNVSTLTAGATAVALPVSASTVGGLTYTHRSASTTVAAGKAAGSYAGSIAATDAASPANSAAAFPFTVVVDNTAPAASQVSTTNAGGAAGVGRIGSGDTMTWTWTEPIDPASIISGWDGTGSQIVTVSIANGNRANPDTVSITNSANTATLPLGTVSLGSSGYITTATATFGGPTNATRSTMTWNSTTGAITVTFGPDDAGGGSPTQVTTGSRGTWTPSSSAYDRAGNACSTTAWTEPTNTIKF
jgi:hypothetical protein